MAEEKTLAQGAEESAENAGAAPQKPAEPRAESSAVEASGGEPKTTAQGDGDVKPSGPGKEETKTLAQGTGEAKPDSESEAAKKARKKRKRQIREIKTFFLRLVAMIIMLYVLFGVVFGVRPMSNDDMKPRISAGDLLLYYRLENRYVANDVVVFEKDGATYVGRIVAQGGDTVEITDNASLVVNGSSVVENDIYYSTPKYDTDVSYPLTLASDEYFLLCDYRTGAKDSRAFGPVKRSEFKGKVITVLRRSSL